jgi:hypothetical protein
MTENTENQTEASTPLVNPRAGLMRGARLWPDPAGILESPFMENGMQMGYVLVYGEEFPAVYDGIVWHPVIDDPSAWASMQDAIADQYYKIIEHAKENVDYQELAAYITGSAAAPQ